ncbi:hypothetical protein LCGC14_0088630 [marine sediment metagenome]|uniref:Uncharacterized protein n=1 Tax=marine sediment metagenome TaxID=412755 RepID=A0A0F9YHR3_9ZZZZ
MIVKKKENYQVPKKIREWIIDIPDGELYEVYISSDQKVWCTTGRFVHSSGSANATWAGFLSGELNELVLKTMGQEVLSEIISYLKQQNT